MTTHTDIYNEGIRDMLSGGAANFRTATKGIDDNELNSLYSVFKKYNNPQAFEMGAKEALNQPDTEPQGTPEAVPEEQTISAEEITSEAEADPTPATPEEAQLSPEERKKQDAAKGGHVAQILKKVGLAKTPTSRVLSQALMALDIEDLIAVKNAAVVQADKLAKRQARLNQAISTTQGMRIIEHALWQLEHSFDERIF